MTDPAGQYDWLEKTLLNATQSLEKVGRVHALCCVPQRALFDLDHVYLQVYIIGHVPVGYLPFTRNITAVRERHNERLLAIFRKYSHVIAGQFYGHTHRDSIMVLLDQQGEAFLITYV